MVVQRSPPSSGSWPAPNLRLKPTRPRSLAGSRLTSRASRRPHSLPPRLVCRGGRRAAVRSAWGGPRRLSRSVRRTAAALPRSHIRCTWLGAYMFPFWRGPGQLPPARSSRPGRLNFFFCKRPKQQRRRSRRPQPRAARSARRDYNTGKRGAAAELAAQADAAPFVGRFRCEPHEREAGAGRAAPA